MSILLRLCVVGLFFCQGIFGDLIVQLPNGKVQGATLDTLSGRTFYTWRGIPFAKPPLAELRYLAPVKAEPWEGVLDASKDAPACVFFSRSQKLPSPINGQSEDCLYINVYSPVAVGSDSNIGPILPVMFWIYGGGFSIGTGDFAFSDPTPFLEENVIVVTFNYRLGPMGFLSTEDDVIPGNAGLKDQWLALMWTRENIAYFGGNSSDVTLFGESAGAISVGYHIASPMSKNLFKAAIMESSSPLNGMLSGANEIAYTLASAVDSSIAKDNTSIQIKEILQGVDIGLIVNLSFSLQFGPVIESKSNFSFLSDPLYELIESGNIASVPIIIGFNSEEALFFIKDLNVARQQAKRLDSNLKLITPAINLRENVSAETVGKEIYEFYVGENGSFEQNILAFVEWCSDNICLRNIHKYGILHSKLAPVYMYQFSFYGTISKGNLIVPGAGKVGHTDEVGYLFNISTQNIATDEDYLTRKRLVKLWTNFAKSLNPTPKDDSAGLLQNVTWEPMTETNIQYLDIDINLQMKTSTNINHTRFWDSIWSTYSYRPYNTF